MFEEIDDLLNARHPETNDPDAIGYIIDYLIKKERMWLQNYIDKLKHRINMAPNESTEIDLIQTLRAQISNAQTQLDKLQNS